MSLRKRLVLSLVGSGCLIVAAVALARELVLRHTAESAARSMLEARVDAIGRERCEQGLLPGPWRPPRGFPAERGAAGDPTVGAGQPVVGPGEPAAGSHAPPPGSEGEPAAGSAEPRTGAGESVAGSGEPRTGGARPLRRGPEGPPGPGLPRRPVEVFFFGRDFAPRIEGGPAFPAEARDALARGASFRLLPARERRGPGTIGVLATGWASERCAYAVGFLPTPPPPLSVPAFVAASLVFLGALAGALYVAAASPVRRIRALAGEVRESATARYEKGVCVDGRDEIGALAAAFNEAGAEVRSQLVDLERREQTLRDFVANTTHDVSLPLSVLAGHLTEMRERVASGQPVDPALVAAAARETQYLGSLLHNLGAVSRLETEDTLRERHPVDLRALVERVALRHAGPAKDQGVELNHAVPADPVFSEGDVTLIEQALNNLVLNAIRYNRSGGHVAVVLDSGADGFELTVADDGPGVTEEELGRLGEARFRGGEARSRRPEGSGLGLSIAKDVAARHGFRLEFRRPEAGGLLALLAGPVAPAPGLPADAAAT